MTSPFFLKKPIFRARALDNTGGLIGYWPLDMDVLDYSGRGKNGTLGTGQRFSQGIIRASVFRKSTSGDYVALPGNIFSSNVYTISLWCYLSINNAYQGLFSVWTNDFDAAELFGTNDGKFFGGAFNNQATATAGAAVTNRWIHLALTSTGSVLQLFLNGQRNGTQGITRFSTFSTTAGITARTGGGFPLQNGYVDDVRVYNRVLSDGEISAIYNLGLTGPDEGEMPALPGPAGPAITFGEVIMVGCDGFA